MIKMNTFIQCFSTTHTHTILKANFFFQVRDKNENFLGDSQMTKMIFFWKKPTVFWKKTFPFYEVGHWCCPDKTKNAETEKGHADRFTTSGSKWHHKDFSHF